MKFKTLLITALTLVVITTNSFAGATLSVHTSSPCTPDNVWSGWKNIARPSFQLEYSHHWKQVRIHVYDNDNNSYSKDVTINRTDCYQWPEDLPTDHYSWTANFYDDSDPNHPFWTGEYHGSDFYIDRTAPAYPGFGEDHSGAITSNILDRWRTHNSPHFLISGSDPGSGINHFEMSINGGAWFTVSNGYHPTLNDGRYIFRLRVIDNVGLVKNALHPLYLNIDANAPNPPSITVYNGTISDVQWPEWGNVANPKFDIHKGSDGAGSGVDKNYVAVNDGEYSSLRVSLGGTSTWSPTFVSGEYKLEFYSSDRVNFNSNHVIKYIRIDVDKPDIEITYPLSDELLSSNTVHVQWSGSDQHSGIDHYEYSTDSVTWVNVSSEMSADLENLEDGEHFVFVKDVDVAGNDSICKVKFITDITPPQITSDLQNCLLEADDNCSATLPDYIDSISVTDNISNDLTIIQDPAAGSVITGETNTVTLQATDEAGNMSEISFNVGTEDTTAPVFTCSNDTTIAPDPG